jgi:hypothetical protein
LKILEVDHKTDGSITNDTLIFKKAEYFIEKGGLEIAKALFIQVW